MCTVSAMYDYGRNIPLKQWTKPGWTEYQELLEKARKFDEIMAQPDCHDPLKTAWIKDVEKRLKKLEGNSLKSKPKL